MNVLVHKASELQPQTRAVLEAEFGRAFQDDEEVSIIAVAPHEAPGDIERDEAAKRLQGHLRCVDEKMKGIPEAEKEEILLEAIRSVRPGYRER
jgi:hypothetical protein